MAIFVSAQEIERNINIIMRNHMILNFYKNNTSNFKELLSDAYYSSDMQIILDKLDLDVEFSPQVRMPDKKLLANDINYHISMIGMGKLSLNNISEELNQSIKYINDVLDFRNPVQGRRSAVDALVHGGFHLAPKLC